MKTQIPREVLLRAVKLIKQWHDFPLPAENAPEEMFKIYYDHAPEMKSIREVLGPYDEIKDEVISATSETSTDRDGLAITSEDQ